MGKPSPARRISAPFQAILLILLFLTVLAWLFVQYYRTSDDTTLWMILKGLSYTDQPSEWTIFLNILLGKVLKTLYRTLPEVAWFPFLLTGTLAVSLWVALAVLLSCTRTVRAKLFVAILLMSAWLKFFIFIDWSEIAMISGLTGVWGFVATARDRRSGWLSGASIALMAASYALRTFAFYGAILVTLPLWAGEAIKARRVERAERRVLWARISVLILVLALLWTADQVTYHRHPEWRAALQYHIVHEWLWEFKNPPFDERTLPIFREVDWGLLDYLLFGTWYGGVGKFGLENLRYLYDRFPFHPFRGWRAFFGCFKDPHASFLLLLLLPVSAWISGRVGLRTLMYIAWIALVFILLYVYYKMTYRVFIPVLAYLVLVILWEASREHPKPHGPGGHNGLKNLSVLAATFLVLYHSLSVLQEDRRMQTQEKLLESSLKSLSPRKDQLYVAWRDGIHTFWMRTSWDGGPLKELNLYPIKALQATPHAETMRKRFGLEDPLRDLVDRPDVFVVPDDIPWAFLKRYYAVKYGMEVDAVGPRGGEGCWAWRIVRRKKGDAVKPSPAGPAWPRAASSRGSGTTR